MKVCENCGAEFEGKFCPWCKVLTDPYFDSSDVAINSSKICRKCGATVTGNFCSACETKFDSNQKICRNCGAVVDGEYCSRCGTRYISSRHSNDNVNICNECGDPYKGNFCPNCVSKVEFIEDNGRFYLKLNNAICSLFLAFGILIVIACVAMPFAVHDYDSRPRYDRLVDKSFWGGGAEDWFNVFCFVNLAAAIAFSISGFFRGNRNVGKISLYQIVGIFGLFCMLFLVINGALICCEIPYWAHDITKGDQGSYFVGAGPVFVTAISSAFFVVTLALFVYSLRLRFSKKLSSEN